MRSGAYVRGISLKGIDFAAGLPHVRSALSSARAPKIVTGVLAIGLAAAVVHEGLDIRWALGASALATSSDQERSSARSNESAARLPALQALVNAHLFGLAPAPEEGLAAAQRDTTLVLTGTIATRHPSSGFAIIGASAETAHIHPVGDSLARGVVLRAVYRDHVVVDRSGQLSVVFFPRNGKALLTAATSPRGVRNNPDDADSEESQRQHIDDAIEAESERTAAFVRQQPFYSGGRLRGIVLQPGSDPAMLAQLGLKAGDVLEWVDGSVIAQPDRLDWLRQRLQSGQPVDLSVIRPGSGQVDVKIPGGAVNGMIEN
jgi:type II secretion system protein C